MIKYPRTMHVQGSRLQPGDEDLSQVPATKLAGQPLVIEEKLDGANAGVFFSAEGQLRLQSRGHILVGGPREKHFAMLKTWAAVHQPALWDVLRDRYVMYGEWLYAKHTVYYDRLPHWFMEFDVWDRKAQEFLSTMRRRQLLKQAPVVSVPVIYEGPGQSEKHYRSLIQRSLYKSDDWFEALMERAQRQGLDASRVAAQTDPHAEAEGLYIKHETETAVIGRYKFIRDSFLQSVQESDGHWLDRPIVPNELAPGVDIMRDAREGT